MRNRRHGSKEQTPPAQKAAARILRRRTGRSPGRSPTGRSLAARRGSPAGTGSPAAAHARAAAAPSSRSRPSAGRSTSDARCGHSAGARSLLPRGPATDRDDGWTHVRVAHRGVDRASRSAPGLTRGNPAIATTDFFEGSKKLDRVAVLAQGANKIARRFSCSIRDPRVKPLPSSLRRC
jgi:hypothetical protein